MNGVASRFALREMRGGMSGVWLLIACLALGVAVITGARSLGADMRNSMSDNARALLGGDAAISLNDVPPTSTQSAFLSGFGTVSQSTQLRAMAAGPVNSGAAPSRVLVELKAVDGNYPLVGSLDLDPSQSTAQALDQKDGIWGAAADPDLLGRLGLKLGDKVKVGDSSFLLRATITREPDRVASPVTLGPRLMIDRAALPATGLIQPGSLIQYVTLVRLGGGATIDGLKVAAATEFPNAGWQIRDSSNAAPGLARFLDQLTMFLSLIGLATLLVGGIGVANGVTAFLEARGGTIATLKCLGAPRRLILAMYAWQIAALAGLGIIIGLVAGAAIPWLVVGVWGNLLPLPVNPVFHPGEVALAGLFGVLVALAFATWPLARAAEISGVQLFRDAVSPTSVRPGLASMAVMALAGIVLAALAIVTAPEWRLAAWFVGGAILTFGLFAGLGTGFARLAGVFAHAHIRLPWRMALSNLSRPGSSTRGVMLSLGLGLTVLVMVALVESDLVDQIEQRLPAEAPSFFFLDVPSDQGALFDQAVTKAGGQVAARAAMVRGRVVKIAGVPVEQANIAPDARWAARGDRGVSTAATAPDDARISAGKWWPADYSGPPLLSLDAAVAKGFGVGVGDIIGITILGREIDARIANLRDVDYSMLAMNFAMILSPNTLAGAPHGDIATVFAAPDKELPVEQAALAALPSVTAINVKEALDEVRGVMAGAAGAMRAAAGITLIAGALVLAGAAAAGRRRRLREAVLFKVLGARRADLLEALATEYVALGAAAAVLAVIIGGIAARGVVVGLLQLQWSFPAIPALVTAFGAILAVTIAGLLLTGRVLSERPAPMLRRE